MAGKVDTGEMQALTNERFAAHSAANPTSVKKRTTSEDFSVVSRVKSDARSGPMVSPVFMILARRAR